MEAQSAARLGILVMLLGVVAALWIQLSTFDMNLSFHVSNVADRQKMELHFVLGVPPGSDDPWGHGHLDDLNKWREKRKLPLNHGNL